MTGWYRVLGWGLAVIFGLVFWVLQHPNFARAESALSDQQCLTCHAKDSKEIKTSIHRDLSCLDCHSDTTKLSCQSGTAGTDSEVVNRNCASCHSDAAREYANSIHGDAGEYSALNCAVCHGDHVMLASSNPKSKTYPRNIPETCTSCHRGNEAKSYEESFHGRALALGSLRTAECTDCHGSRNILAAADPKSGVAKANLAQTCASCHKNAVPNFAVGAEHTLIEREGPGSPRYYTLKIFVWLTILTVVGLILHMQLELFRMWRDSRKSGAKG